jgi:hypothetical protein
LYPLKQGYIELFAAKNSDIVMARAKRHYIIDLNMVRAGVVKHPSE